MLLIYVHIHWTSDFVPTVHYELDDYRMNRIRCVQLGKIQKYAGPQKQMPCLNLVPIQSIVYGLARSHFAVLWEFSLGGKKKILFPE